MRKLAAVVVCAAIVAVNGSLAQNAASPQMPKDYQEVLSILGKNGDFKDHVLKVNVPRRDLHVTVAGVPTPTPFGFGGWVGMTRGNGGKDVMMGDLVLLEDEVNPVMSALLDHGLQVTALHNHFYWEQPRIVYMHVHGYGSAADLAREVKPALDLIGHVKSSGTAAAAPEPSHASQNAIQGGINTLSTQKLDGIIGHKGDTAGSIYKVTVGRDDIALKEMGATINARMGLNSWAAVVGSDADAAIAGDIAMREGEVQQVLKTLRKNDLDIVAIHQHMIGTSPTVIFLHYWGTGPAQKLAQGFRAVLDQLGKAAPGMPEGMEH